MISEPLLQTAYDAAIAAGSVLLSEWPRVLAQGARATKSSATDPVTTADIAAQQAIADHLTRTRPDDGLVGEEGLRREGSSGLRWIIDPLDGTVNYLYGREEWAVSIAAEDSAGTVVGVVHVPALNRTYSAVRGQGSRLGDRRLSVRDPATMATALVGTGFSYTADGRADQAAVLTRLLPQVADLRRTGSAAIDLATLAAGTLDAFYENDLAHWDWAAGALLATEAGATVTPLPGPGGHCGVLAAAPRLHAALAGVLSETP